jgi:hypothetical protein
MVNCIQISLFQSCDVIVPHLSRTIRNDRWLSEYNYGSHQLKIINKEIPLSHNPGFKISMYTDKAKMVASRPDPRLRFTSPKMKST